MDFTYSEEQVAVRNSVERFAQKEIAPRATAIDQEGEFPYDIYRQLGEMGLITMPIPTEVGGGGSDFLSYALAIEEIARADSGLVPTLTAQLSVCKYITQIAPEAQRASWIEKYVKPIARGEATGATATTEPNSSALDKEAMTTLAVRDGNEWVINGTKMFSTCAGLENNRLILVWALRERATKKVDLFLVPRDAPGLNLGRPLEKMGMRSAHTRELFLTDCRIPAENCFNMAEARQSGKLRNLHFHSRLMLASGAIGLHRYCLDESLAFAKTRVTFGLPLSQRQLIQGWLAEMATDLELSRLLRDKCAWLYDNNQMTLKDDSMLKYVCAENAAKAANYASEIHGGMGFMNECGVSRRYRDAKGLTIIQGGTPLHKWRIAQELGC